MAKTKTQQFAQLTSEMDALGLKGPDRVAYLKSYALEVAIPAARKAANKSRKIATAEVATHSKGLDAVKSTTFFKGFSKAGQSKCLKALERLAEYEGCTMSDYLNLARVFTYIYGENKADDKRVVEIVLDAAMQFVEDEYSLREWADDVHGQILALGLDHYTGGWAYNCIRAHVIQAGYDPRTKKKA